MILYLYKWAPLELHERYSRANIEFDTQPTIAYLIYARLQLGMHTD